MRTAAAASRRATRVLLVDPDAGTRALYREALRLIATDIVEAVDARDALVKALVHAPTAVVMEIRLPGFDGCDLCEILRRDVVTRSAAIVVVTRESRPAELERVHAAGADAVLSKSAAIEQIVGEVQRWLSSDGRGPTPSASTAPASLTADRRPKPGVKAHLRGTTTTPPQKPPALRCPRCDSTLRYESSIIGGVSSRYAEQWDGFSCACGAAFEYRHRTRKLRRTR